MSPAPAYPMAALVSTLALLAMLRAPVHGRGRQRAAFLGAMLLLLVTAVTADSPATGRRAPSADSHNMIHSSDLGYITNTALCL